MQSDVSEVSQVIGEHRIFLDLGTRYYRVIEFLPTCMVASSWLAGSVSYEKFCWLPIWPPTYP